MHCPCASNCPHKPASLHVITQSYRRIRSLILRRPRRKRGQIYLLGHRPLLAESGHSYAKICRYYFEVERRDVRGWLSRKLVPIQSVLPRLSLRAGGWAVQHSGPGAWELSGNHYFHLYYHRLGLSEELGFFTTPGSSVVRCCR